MKVYPKISEIINLPIIEQSKFADAVCVENVNNPEILKTIDDEPNFKLWNATSIGNLAYIAIHCNGTFYRCRADELLSDFKKWYLSSFN